MTVLLKIAKALCWLLAAAAALAAAALAAAAFGALAWNL